jgi:cell division protein FtsB
LKYFSYLLIGLIIAIQWPLWFGKGGWLKVWDMSRQVEAAKASNGQLALRNGGLDAEVRDLKQGLEAVEERARADLGMIKPNEVFVQLVEKPSAQRK